MERSYRSRPTHESSTLLTAQVRPPGWDERQVEPPQYQPPAHDFSHVDLFSHAPQNRPPVQLKLTEERGNEPELEVDRDLEQPTTTAETPPNPASSSGLRSIQRSTQGSVAAGETIENQLSATKGQGSPLPTEVRAFMEPRFGTDFSQVRVHTSGAALQMNRDLSAQAFTYGQDVYFGAGKSPANDDLTAHELTHVVQQTGTAQTKRIQRAIGPTHDLTHGTFNVTATPQDAASGGPNVPITIGFTPKTTAPISNQIGLIQIVKLTNAAGTNVEPQSLPAAR